MSTTKANIEAAAEMAHTLGELLRVDAAEFPEPCPPPVVCPPAEDCPVPLAEVRALFGSGAQWSDRNEWQAAMGRPSGTRSLWAAGATVDQHVTWWRDIVDDILADPTDTVYVIGMHPWPGQASPPALAPLAYYDRVAAELRRLPAADRLRVWVRFGWEPDGDWYAWSWRPKGQPFSEERYLRFSAGWIAWRQRTPGIHTVLNLTAGVTTTLAERAVRELRPDAYTMDIYATYEMRDPVRWLRRLTEQVELADRFGIPWAIDETSPYVDKVVNTVQRGGLDSALSISLLHALVQFVQWAAGRGTPPLWVQFFERNLPEGKFAIVSRPTDALTGTSTLYRSASGLYRYSTAPRTAAALVALLGTWS